MPFFPFIFLQGKFVAPGISSSSSSSLSSPDVSLEAVQNKLGAEALIADGLELTVISEEKQGGDVSSLTQAQKSARETEWLASLEESSKEALGLVDDAKKKDGKKKKKKKSKDKKSKKSVAEEGER